MGRCIDARLVDGEMRYRVWSSVVDAYVESDDPRGLTAKQVRRWCRRDLLRRTLEDFARTWTQDIERADTTGTSARIGTRPGLDAPWRSEEGD